MVTTSEKKPLTTTYQGKAGRFLSPIRVGLRTTLYPATSAEANAVQAFYSTASVIVANNLITNLILNLINLPSARVLLRNRASSLFIDLTASLSHLNSNDFDINLNISLVERVIYNASDVEIWSAVLELVERVEHASPQPITPLLPSRKPSPAQRYDRARPLEEGLSRHTTRLFREYLRNLLIALITILEASMNDTLKGSPGQTTQKDTYEKSIAQYTEGR